MGKIDYALKAVVLSEHDDLIAASRTLHRADYLRAYHPDVPINQNKVETAQKVVSDFLQENLGDATLLIEAEKINKAYYTRKKRLQTHIENMLNRGTCHFLTVTFKDDVLNSTTPQTRRRYVARFLKSLAPVYIANIDFGAQNGREHYHAIVRSDTADVSSWQYGFTNVQKVRSEKDAAALAKYTSKLTNHAIKDTTKGSRLIYSAK